jgi:hypothetical protein
MKSLQDLVVHRRLYGLNFKFKLFYFIQTSWGPPVSLTVQTEAHRPPSCPHPRLCYHRSSPPFPPPCSHRPPPRVALRGAHRRMSSSFLLLPFTPHLCSACRSPLPPLQPTPMPSSAQATPLSRSTVLKRAFTSSWLL